ncbi:MAG: hypothetical protein E4H13_14790 [Calditrichales bacterium]|nr:MAG: hypothetical protein E4H13_14790 [Calditrichales bacterium]
MKKMVKILLCCSIIFILIKCDSASEPEENTPTYEPGLKASYSTGVNKIESSVYHGWASACASTGNNMYEGQCVEISLSPVDWAWGNFSANWEGFIYIPEPGQYTFNSHFWVDGIIHIEINDTVIADINTPGGGYGKTMTFSNKNWYPVTMTFASNGGSNNMHLGWIKPGSEWEIVPADKLGHRKE